MDSAQAGIVALCLLAASIAYSEGACEFPESMRGEWFQKSYSEPIIITQKSLSKHGICRERKHDKFLLYNKNENTYSFVVITQKHPNVMQYKETPNPLKGNWTLDAAYSELSGDTPLYSVFRTDGDLVPCPFRDTYEFSYNRGTGNCSSPPSISDSCTDKSRVLFNYKACYDILGSETKQETLSCVGTWKEGSHHFLVGKVHHMGVHSNEDRFRCYIFEERRKDGRVEGYDVAVSGDATCDGVQSPNEGSTTLVLRRNPKIHEKRTFPSWMYEVSHHWRTLSRNKSYEISRENSSLVIQTASYIEQRWSCEDVYDKGENMVQLVVHSIEGCDSGYICLMVYRRASNLLELQQGSRTARSADACLSQVFDPLELDYITLVAEPTSDTELPIVGQFSMIGKDHLPIGALVSPVNTKLECGDQLSLWAGCQSPASFEVRAECEADKKPVTKQMVCQATWETDDQTFMVLSTKGATHESERFCIAVNAARSRVFFGGGTSCSRKMMQGYHVDLYRETECPPQGISSVPTLSPIMSLLVVFLIVGQSVL